MCIRDRESTHDDNMLLYRTEFAVHRANTTFNPVDALVTLYTVFQHAQSDLILYSSDRTTAFLQPDTIPTSSVHFHQHFLVTPQLYPSGSGNVHIHLCLENTINMTTMRQIPEIAAHLKQKMIWITPHRYTTHKLTTVGAC